MPKRNVAVPTNIYWLYDMRPEKVAAFGEMGEPFYCGKTVFSANHRLSGHIRRAKRKPSGKVSARILQCGTLVVSRVVETVPPNGDWISRERHWIAELRRVNPLCTNIGEGGVGTAGFTFTDEQRKRISEGLKRFRILNPEVAKQLDLAAGERNRKNPHSELTKFKRRRSQIATWQEKLKASLEDRYFIDPEFDEFAA